MSAEFIAFADARSEHDLIVYHRAETNHCPRCGGTMWVIGRITAECAGCHAALPLVSDRPDPPITVEQGN